ncbi:MAG: acyl-CoA thioester hydrolase [Limisphaerales bacterium]|jgi:acyl-CoA thioester hydrolase
MPSYYQKFHVRWSDIDANRHVANTAYSNFMIHTRMSYLRDLGFTQVNFEHHQIGPAVLSETFYYYKEVSVDASLRVDIALDRLSEDDRFVRFAHGVFTEDGSQAAFAHTLFCWLNLESRKIVDPPSHLASIIKEMPRTEDFQMLSRDERLAGLKHMERQIQV